MGGRAWFVRLNSAACSHFAGPTPSRMRKYNGRNTASTRHGPRLWCSRERAPFPLSRSSTSARATPVQTLFLPCAWPIQTAFLLRCVSALRQRTVLFPRSRWNPKRPWLPVACPTPCRAGSRSILRLRVSREVNGQVVLSRKQQVYLEPFRKEVVDAEERLAALGELTPQLFDSRGITGQVLEIEHKLSACREQAFLAGALPSQARGALQTDLADVLTRSSDLLDRVQAAVEVRDLCKNGQLVCAANPWAPFGDMQEAIEQRTPAAGLTVRAFKGETESAALNVFNFSSQPHTFRVEQGDLAHTDGEQTAAGKQVIALHEVVDIPTQTMDVSPDALPALNQGNLLVVPAWGARQLWLNVDTATLAPGDWSGSVRLRTLEPESIELTASLDVTVWEPAFAGAPAGEPVPLGLRTFLRAEGSVRCRLGGYGEPWNQRVRVYGRGEGEVR